jgi:hypothetical protein
MRRPLLLLAVLVVGGASASAAPPPGLGTCQVAPYAKCAGADMRGKSLAGKDLRNANFKGADLRGVDMTNAYMHQADLSGAKLDNVKAQHVHLGHANLSAANLTDADLGHAHLGSVNAGSANFSRTKLGSADFTHADVRQAIFTDAHFASTKFGVAHASGVTIFPSNFDTDQTAVPGLYERVASHIDAYGRWGSCTQGGSGRRHLMQANGCSGTDQGHGPLGVRGRAGVDWSFGSHGNYPAVKVFYYGHQPAGIWLYGFVPLNGDQQSWGPAFHVESIRNVGGIHPTQSVKPPGHAGGPLHFIILDQQNNTPSGWTFGIYGWLPKF